MRCTIRSVSTSRTASASNSSSPPGSTRWCRGFSTPAGFRSRAPRQGRRPTRETRPSFRRPIRRRSGTAVVTRCRTPVCRPPLPSQLRLAMLSCGAPMDVDRPHPEVLVQRLSPLDASFLHIESGSSPMHIASTAIFEGPPPGAEAVLRMVKSKLPLVPRYRQKVRFVPFELGRPVWIDDPHFNLEYHVRHTALPAPGSDVQLRNLVGRIMSQALDRAKPLWEMWIVEGLEDG